MTSIFGISDTSTAIQWKWGRVLLQWAPWQYRGWALAWRTCLLLPITVSKINYNISSAPSRPVIMTAILTTWGSDGTVDSNGIVGLAKDAEEIRTSLIKHFISQCGCRTCRVSGRPCTKVSENFPGRSVPAVLYLISILPGIARIFLTGNYIIRRYGGSGQRHW